MAIAGAKIENLPSDLESARTMPFNAGARRCVYV
jgi:hypothetical protein